MADSIKHLQAELAEIVERHTGKEGSQSTPIPFLSFSRYTAPHSSSLTGPPYRLPNPMLCIVVQGTKEVTLGEDRFSYGPADYVVAAMDLPVIAEVLEASPETPNLTCKIELTPGRILELLGDDELKASASNRASKRGMNIAQLDLSLLDAIVRLVRLLDKPADIPVLAPLFTTEILYKTLQGEHGDSLRQIVTDGSPAVHIKQAIEHILQHFQDSLHTRELAEIAGMSVPSFHRHFKEITAMSPIQFQKQLRLQEARRLLITGSVNAADASFQVGYESPTQFSREYSRMFGAPPREDMKRLKGIGRH